MKWFKHSRRIDPIQRSATVGVVVLRKKNSQAIHRDLAISTSNSDCLSRTEDCIRVPTGPLLKIAPLLWLNFEEFSSYNFSYIGILTL